MTLLLWAHVAAGSIAIAAGTAAVAARKGGALHARAGSWFLASMLILGVTATILARQGEDPASGLGGMLTCYFVTTSWVAARRRDGTTGRFEIVACLAVLCTGAAIGWAALSGTAATPAGRFPLFASAALCLLAASLDLNAILRNRLSPAQRISRHLWRMCVAFFIATGSFFIGQQDAMPEAVRGSALLFILGFGPLGVMAFWLARIRFAKVLVGGARRSELMQ